MAEVLTSTPPPQSDPCPADTLLRASSSHTSLYLAPSNYAPGPGKSRSVSPARSSGNRPTSHSTLSSYFSSDVYKDFDLDDDDDDSASEAPTIQPSAIKSFTFDSNYSDDLEDEDICFPTYGDNTSYQKPREDSTDATWSSSNDTTTSTAPTPDYSSPPTESSEPDHGIQHVADDIEVKAEPSQQVDYLSHNWKEEDIWSSWKHIVSQRKVYGERSRLENASWRTWTKQKYNLKTVSPETLNWLKDCDVTWLYGPLQPASDEKQGRSEPNSHLSKSSSFLDKKPILKKRSASEIMLQKSISSSSLVKEAAAAVQAQRKFRQGSDGGNVKLRRTVSDFIGIPPNPQSTTDASVIPSSSSSGAQSPSDGSKRHIRFDNKVEQCIAVDFKANEGEDTEVSRSAVLSDESEDDLPTLKTSGRKHLTPRPDRSSPCQESKGIAMLPSTTLKFHNDPQCQAQQGSQFGSSSSLPWKSGALSHSSSQETLKPAPENPNFLLNDDDLDDEVDWEPSGAFSNLRRDSVAPVRYDESMTHVPSMTAEDEERAAAGLRRTNSGMFMPFDDEDEDEAFYNSGFLGKMIDTVNTARDIATVVWWNVGWGNKE